MKVGVNTIEIPAGALVDSTHTCEFDFEAQGLLFLWNGRSGGANAVGAASHRMGVGAWASNNQVAEASASEDAQATVAAKSRASNGAAVALVDGDGNNVGTATADPSWDGATCTVTLTVTATVTAAVTISVEAYGGLSVGCHAINLQVTSTTATATGMAGTPDALILFHRSNATNAAGITSDSQWMIGFAARNGGSTEEAVILGFSDDGLDTSDTYRWGSQTRCFVSEGAVPAGAPFVEGNVTAWTADGFTLTTTNNPNTRIFGLALIGCDARVLPGTTLTGAGDITLTPGWQAAGGLVISHGTSVQANLANLVDQDVRSVGLFDGALNQRAVGVVDVDAQGTTQVGTAYRSADVYARMATDRTLGGAMQVTAIGATTVTLDMSTADDTGRWFSTLLVGPADAPADPPTAVDDLAAAELRAGENRVTWTDPGDATSYTVQRAPDSSGSPGTWSSLTTGYVTGLGGAMTYDDTTATQGADYHYRVLGVNSEGNTPSNVDGPLTTVSMPTVVIDSPVGGSTQSEGTTWALRSTIAHATTIAWTSNVDGALSSAEDDDVTLSGTDDTPVAHTITATVGNAYGDESSQAVGVVSGLGSTGIIIDEEDPVFTRPYGSTDPIPFTLLASDGSQATGVTFTAGDVQVSLAGAAYANVATLPVATNDDYLWTPAAAETSAAWIRLRIKKAGYRTKHIYIETYGASGALHESGAEAEGTAAAAGAVGALSLSLAVDSGALVRYGEIVFAEGARAIVESWTGAGPFTATLASPGLSAAVGNGEAFNLFGAVGMDKTGFELAGTLGRLDDLENLSADQVEVAAGAALDSYDPPTRAELTADAESLATAINTRAAPGDAMALTSAERDAAANALLDLADSVDGYPVRQILRGMAAVLMGKVSGASGNAPVFRDLADTADRVSATTDEDGNRLAVTLGLED